MKPRLTSWTIALLLVIPTPVFAQSPCAPLFAELLRSRNSMPNAFRDAFLQQHPNPKAADLVAAMKVLSGESSTAQLGLLEAIAPRLTDLDGPRLTEAAGWIKPSDVKAKALKAGFASIRNPKAADLDAAMRLLHNQASAAQRSIIEDHASRILDLDGPKLATAAGWIQDSTEMANAIKAGFAAIKDPKADDLAAALKPLHNKASATQRLIIENQASRIPDLDGPKLAAAAAWIQNSEEMLAAVSAGFPAIRNPKADDLAIVMKLMHGKGSGKQRELIEKVAPGIADLNGAKLAQIVAWIQDTGERAKAVMAGFSAIRRPTPADLDDAARALEGNQGSQLALYKIHSGRTQAAPASPGDALVADVAALGVDSSAQRAMIEKIAPTVPNLTADQLLAATNKILDSSERAKAVLATFEYVHEPKAADLVKAVQSIQGDNSSFQRVLIETIGPKVPDLDASHLVTAARSISGPLESRTAVASGFRSIRNPTAADLEKAGQFLSAASDTLRVLIENAAPRVANLDVPQLLAATRYMANRGEKVAAVRSGFASIQNPTSADFDLVEQTVGKDVRSLLEKDRAPSSGGSAPKGGASASKGTGSAALDELNAMPGTESISAQLSTIRELMTVNQQRADAGLKTVSPMLHARFDGNPGTGKTTVARLYGKMVRELGFLKANGKAEVPIVEMKGTDFVGADAVEKMKKAIKDAEGGVLILDELYLADPAANRNAKEAMGVLLSAMEDDRDKFVTISAGYPKEMDEFIASNDGFKRRFAQKVNFEDYDDKTLGNILRKFARDKDYVVSDAVVASAVQKLARERGKGFGNAGSVRNEFEAAVKRHAARLRRESEANPNPTRDQLQTLTLEDFRPPVGSIDEKLAALDKMAGLDEVKRSVRSVVSLLRLEEARTAQGLPSQRPLLNAVFEGNPGTGKTTVARMYGSMLKDLGYVSKGEFIEVKASDLIGNVVGDSEKKVRDLMARAKGNVLFIDEAYLLFRPESGGAGGYGRAALDALVAAINPDANQDMVVILAGYQREMANMMSSNPGLTRRFPRNAHFADYDGNQLGTILDKKVHEKGFALSPASRKAAVAELSLRRAAKDFGNAGEVENLLGEAQLRQSERLGATGRTDFRAEELKELRPEDFVGARTSPGEVLKELDRLPGLRAVKQAFHEIKETYEEAALIGHDPQGLSGSVYAFEGSSPDEHRAVAGTLGKLLHSQGALPKHGLEVAEATDLKGQYIGESSVKTQRILDAAMGKTLLIRGLNAISNPQNAYEKEVLDTIWSFLQQNRGKAAVIFAGSPDEMKRFVRSNPGLARMIEHDLVFEKLGSHESVTQLAQQFQAAGKSLSAAATRRLGGVLHDLLESAGAGGSADLDQLKTRILVKQAVRSKRDPSADPSVIETADIEAALPQGMTHRYLAGSDSAAPHPASSAPVEPPRERSADAVPVKHHHGHDHAHGESHAPDHAVEHTHPTAAEAAQGAAQLAEAGVHFSDRARQMMMGMEDLIDRQNPASVEKMKESIRRGELTPSQLEELARKLNRPTDPQSLSRLAEESKSAIQEFKRGAEALKEQAKTNEKAKRLIQHYVCLACGRSNCSYMPYTWFTEEL